jgi:hypothetical protein
MVLPAHRLYYRLSLTKTLRKYINNHTNPFDLNYVYQKYKKILISFSKCDLHRLWEGSHPLKSLNLLLSSNLSVLQYCTKPFAG